MESVYDELERDTDDLPKLSTICRLLYRFKMGSGGSCYAFGTTPPSTDVFRANTAVLPLPTPLQSYDTNAESDGLG